MKINYKELQVFLESLNYKMIIEGALIEAHTILDIERFGKNNLQKRKLQFEQVIFYNDPFLVDAIGNDLSVCILTKRKYKLPTGRVVNMKFDRTIISDCTKTYSSCINGYFVIPDRFITTK